MTNRELAACSHPCNVTQCQTGSQTTRTPLPKYRVSTSHAAVSWIQLSSDRVPIASSERHQEKPSAHQGCSERGMRTPQAAAGKLLGLFTTRTAGYLTFAAQLQWTMGAMVAFGAAIIGLHRYITVKFPRQTLSDRVVQRAQQRAHHKAARPQTAAAPAGVRGSSKCTCLRIRGQEHCFYDCKAVVWHLTCMAALQSKQAAQRSEESFYCCGRSGRMLNPSTRVQR